MAHFENLDVVPPKSANKIAKCMQKAKTPESAVAGPMPPQELSEYTTQNWFWIEQREIKTPTSRTATAMNPLAAVEILNNYFNRLTSYSSDGGITRIAPIS